MNQFPFFIIFSCNLAAINFASKINEKDDSCYKDDDSIETCQSVESSVKWQRYLQNIDMVLKFHKECTSQNCSCFESRLKDDLNPFKKSGITKEMIKQAKFHGNHFQIINKRLYRQKDCMFEARCEGVEHFLLEILEDLPDLEFILNDRDYPRIFNELIPTLDSLDILYPAWSFWSGGPAISLHPNGIGRWDNMRDRLNKASNLTPWTKKIPRGFFRGSRTSSERDPLILLSRINSNLMDAAYTRNQAWKSDKDTLGQKPAEEVHFEDHCRFKYLFNMRGVAASFRLRHLFLCKSAVFHVGSDWLEFFYDTLIPWVHFVPVSKSLQDAEYLLRFAQDNDPIIERIARRLNNFYYYNVFSYSSGRDFIWKHLQQKDIACYWRQLLINYAKLIKYEVVLDRSLNEITK